MIQRLKAGNEAGSGEMKRNEAGTGHQISAQLARGNPASFSKDYRAAYEACKLQAQIWKQEALAANHTIAEIYQAVTGATGEPGNWNGAEPVRRALAERGPVQVVGS
jgi:hypothetical protein